MGMMKANETDLAEAHLIRQNGVGFVVPGVDKPVNTPNITVRRRGNRLKNDKDELKLITAELVVVLELAVHNLFELNGCGTGGENVGAGWTTLVTRVVEIQLSEDEGG